VFLIQHKLFPLFTTTNCQHGNTKTRLERPTFFAPLPNHKIRRQQTLSSPRKIGCPGRISRPGRAGRLYFCRAFRRGSWRKSVSNLRRTHPRGICRKDGGRNRRFFCRVLQSQESARIFLLFFVCHFFIISFISSFLPYLLTYLLT